jgi:hypothetical protein
MKMILELSMELLAISITGTVGALYLYQRTDLLSFVRPVRSAVAISVLVYILCAWQALYASSHQTAWLIAAGCVLLQTVLFMLLAYQRAASAPAGRDGWRKHIKLSALVLVTFLAPLAIAFGSLAGRTAGAELRVKLLLVWPDLLNMPVHDRVVLVRLGIRCNASKEPTESTAVLRCLRDVAHASEAKRLEELIPFAQRKAI